MDRSFVAKSKVRRGTWIWIPGAVIVAKYQPGPRDGWIKNTNWAACLDYTMKMCRARGGPHNLKPTWSPLVALILWRRSTFISFYQPSRVVEHCPCLIRAIAHAAGLASVFHATKIPLSHCTFSRLLCPFCDELPGRSHKVEPIGHDFIFSNKAAVFECNPSRAIR